MRHSFLLLTVAFLVSSPAAPAPDYTGINRATANLLTVLDTLLKEAPLVQDAQGAAKAVNSFATALDDFTTAMADFAQRFPEATKGSAPPKDVASAFAALSQLKTKYSSVPGLVGSQANRFRESPEVSKAVAKLQMAVERIDRLSKR